MKDDKFLFIYDNSPFIVSFSAIYFALHSALLGHGDEWSILAYCLLGIAFIVVLLSYISTKFGIERTDNRFLGEFKFSSLSPSEEQLLKKRKELLNNKISKINYITHLNVSDVRISDNFLGADLVVRKGHGADDVIVVASRDILIGENGYNVNVVDDEYFSSQSVFEIIKYRKAREFKALFLGNYYFFLLNIFRIILIAIVPLAWGAFFIDREEKRNIGKDVDGHGFILVVLLLSLVSAFSFFVAKLCSNLLSRVYMEVRTRRTIPLSLQVFNWEYFRPDLEHHLSHIRQKYGDRFDYENHNYECSYYFLRWQSDPSLGHGNILNQGQ
ncbi:hypothetical protein [Halobacteriovorax sp. CON-3]|uniref:hypothetical protein n=1 Tax=Halobacteriovorax sp. CON-3 TaxID=3157710 RepID=UPI0037127ADE